MNFLTHELRVLQCDGDVHGQSYQINFGFSTGTFSDPVGAYVDKIIELEAKINKILIDISPVDKFLCALKAFRDQKRAQEIQNVLKAFYFERQRLNKVAVQLHMNVKKISQTRRQIVYQVMKYIL